MTEKKTGAAGKVTLGMLKGKSITTSVPSFAIRFHTEDEELEEIYPAAAQDTDEEPDKPAATGASFEEDESLSSSTPQKTPSISASATTSTIHSRDPSPMKEYLKGFGKRSTSVDAGMIKAGATGSSSDTWRIFHELKGKFTKTVEEKFSEIKSDRKSGSSVLRKGRLVAGGGSSSKDDSSMNSDSEDVSESSKKNDDDDISESKSQEPAKSMQESPSKPKSSPAKKVTIASSTPDVDVEDVGKAGVRKRKLEGGALQGIVEYEVESGVEAKEDVLYDAIEDNLEEWQKDIPTTDYRSGTPVLVSPMPGRRRRSILRKLWRRRNTLFVACLLLLYILVPIPRYVLGFTNGIIFCIVVYSIYVKITSMFSRLTTAEDSKKSSPAAAASTTASVSTTDEHVIKVHAAREYHEIQKYEGWLNEYPAVYNPETYKVNQTQSVFVRLEGTVLRIYHTKQRIPKRAMWNEREHKKKFYHQRIYNITYCELKLLPEGLARSKLWSKKYPICITFKKHDDVKNPHLLSSAAMDADDDDEYLSTAENLDRSHSTSDISSIGKQPSTEDPEFAETLESEEETFCHVDSRDLETNHLYLFSRTDREKEIWYRKFAAAMREAHHSEDSVLHKSHFNTVAADTCVKFSSLDSEDADMSMDPFVSTQDLLPHKEEEILSLPINDFMTLSHFEHNDYEYLRFMNKTQQVPHYRHDKVQEKEMCRMFHHQHVRAPARPANQAKRQEKLDAEIENDLQKPISDSVMWINALLGRIIFDIMKNPTWHEKIKERAQRKLSSIKLPYFIEGLTLTEMDLGHSMPILHEASQPVLDERGVWVDFDITYDGSICCTLETKVNLMKIKIAGQEAHTSTAHHEHHGHHEHTIIRKPHIYDSELEDSAESSDEDDDDERSSSAEEHSSSGGSSAPRHSTGTKVIRLVNKIAASRYFQQATEYKYIKNVMEQVSNTKLMLSVTVSGLVGTLVVNIPPPPSDRIWYGFRTNPQVWLQTRPKFGERQVSVSHVTTLIEKKLLQEFQKKFVLPNMDDLVISPMSATLPE